MQNKLTPCHGQQPELYGRRMDGYIYICLFARCKTKTKCCPTVGLAAACWEAECAKLRYENPCFYKPRDKNILQEAIQDFRDGKFDTMTAEEFMREFQGVMRKKEKDAK